MCVYKHLKLYFGYKKYFDIIDHKLYRQMFTNMRWCVHKLRIESGWYERNRIDRNERLYQICECGDIEDELQLILVQCDKFKCVTKMYIQTY